MRDLASVHAARQLDVRRFQRGVVRTVVSQNRLSVELAESTEPVTIPAVGSSPAYLVNDLVLVARDATGPVVVGRLGSVPPPDSSAEVTAPPVAPPSAKTARSKVVLASSTGSWRADTGWRGDEVRQGNYGYGLYHGAAYYSRQLVGLGASLSHPRSAVLRYTRETGGVFAAQAPTVWTLAGFSRPAGAPTRLTSAGATAVAVGRTATWELPPGMLDELLDGTAGGLGIYIPGSSPYIVLSSRATDSASMSLVVNYSA